MMTNLADLERLVGRVLDGRAAEKELADIWSKRTAKEPEPPMTPSIRVEELMDTPAPKPAPSIAAPKTPGHAEFLVSKVFSRYPGATLHCDAICSVLPKSVSRQTVLNTLSRMWKKGALERPSKAHYRLAAK